MDRGRAQPHVWLWIGGSLALQVSPRMSTHADPLCPGAAAVPAVQPEAGMGTLLLAPAQAGQERACSGATAGQVGRWPGKVLPSPLCLSRVQGQAGLQSLDMQKCRAASGGLCCSANSSAVHHRSSPRPSSPSLCSPGQLVKVSAVPRSRARSQDHAAAWAAGAAGPPCRRIDTSTAGLCQQMCLQLLLVLLT